MTGTTVARLWTRTLLTLHQTDQAAEPVRLDTSTGLASQKRHPALLLYLLFSQVYEL